MFKAQIRIVSSVQVKHSTTASTRDRRVTKVRAVYTVFVCGCLA